MALLDRMRKRWEQRQAHKALRNPTIANAVAAEAEAQAQRRTVETLEYLARDDPKVAHRAIVKARARARNKQARRSRARNR